MNEIVVNCSIEPGYAKIQTKIHVRLGKRRMLLVEQQRDKRKVLRLPNRGA